MTVATNRNRGLDVEDEACQRWPAKSVPEDRDQRDGWYDLIFTDDIVEDISGSAIVEEGTFAECKSCFADYDDRAGRWWIRRRNHELLAETDGVYVLAIVERETHRILRMPLVDATTIDAPIDGNWWETGNGGRSADEYRQLSWTAVFDSCFEPEGVAR